MPMLQERQYRELQPMAFEVERKRIESSYYVEGYAAKYEPYVLYEDSEGPIYEEFRRGCFENTDMSDVIMQFDHSGKVFARNSSGTLIVEPDEIGLFMAADLSKSEAARNMYEEIANRLITKMSWGFIPGDYFYDEAQRTFVHTSIKKIFDVSAVSIPANDNTNIQARSFVGGVIDEMAKEIRAQKLHEQALRTATLIRLGGL